jgi:hypothetical protein
MNPILFENYLALPESLRERYLQQLFPNEGDRIQFRADLNAYLLGGSSNNDEDSQSTDGSVGGTGTIPLSTAVVNINYCENLINLRTVSVPITYNSTEPNSLEREVSNAVSFYVNNNIPFRYAINQEAPPLTCFIPTFTLPTPTPVPTIVTISPTSTIRITPTSTRIPSATPTPTPLPTSTYYVLSSCNGSGDIITTQVPQTNQLYVDFSEVDTGIFYTYNGNTVRLTSTEGRNFVNNLQTVAGRTNCQDDRKPVAGLVSVNIKFVNCNIEESPNSNLLPNSLSVITPNSSQIKTIPLGFVNLGKNNTVLFPNSYNKNIDEIFTKAGVYTINFPNISDYDTPSPLSFSLDSIEDTQDLTVSYTRCVGDTTDPDKITTSTNVYTTFSGLISPDLQSAYRSRCSSNDYKPGLFVPGEILLNGQSIGRGTASVSLQIGSRYTVEFRKPSHPYFTFSDGSPNNFTFVASSATTTIESLFTPSFAKVTGGLTVVTNITPNIAGVNFNPKIYISNIGQIGEGSVNDYQLEQGQYTLYFEPIKVAGMIFVTPKQRTITIGLCDTLKISETYTGVALPTNYWLKKIDSIDQMKYNSVITRGMFSNGIANMVSFYKSSISDSLDNFYTHVYHERITHPTSSIQFSLAYGHSEGSGSNDEGGQYNDTPTRAIFGQYRSIIVGNTSNTINLSGTPTKHFYAISYQKDRRDTRADYNALELNIAHLSGSEFISSSNMRYHTGSNVRLGGRGKVLRLISDYKINNNPSRATPSAPLEYNIVSGSIEDGVYNSNNPHYFGKLYPSLGLVLLDANKLDVSASLGTVTTREIDGKNQLKLFTAISGAALYTDISGDKLGMKARSTKEELSFYYYIHVKNKEFNYSNNPSIYNTDGIDILKYGVGSNQIASSQILDNTAVINTNFISRPTTYITTIGLYDENRNLIAVGKLSNPELNNFTEEVMFTVKLKF